MARRVAEAIFGYVLAFVPILDNAHFAERVSSALTTRILKPVDWGVISRLELVDTLITLLRHEPVAVRRLMVPVFDRAFQDAFNYRLLFSSCMDRAIGPEILSGLCAYPREPTGPDEYTCFSNIIIPNLL